MCQPESDPGEILLDKVATRVARKDYNCRECGGVIRAGFPYRDHRNIYADYNSGRRVFCQTRVCLLCDSAWERVCKVMIDNLPFPFNGVVPIWGSLGAYIHAAFKDGWIAENSSLMNRRKILRVSSEDATTEDATTEDATSSCQLTIFG